MVHHSEASALAVVQRAPVNVQGSIIVSNAAALDNAAAARSSAYLLQTEVHSCEFKSFGDRFNVKS
jgi:hypothetical protein